MHALMELLFITVFLVTLVKPKILDVSHETYRDTLTSNKVVLVNFYADWCVFSGQLSPIYNKVAELVHEEYKDVKIARVNCEKEIKIAEENNINKFPTIKLYRNGKPLRKEYRGARSVDVLLKYIKLQIKPPVVDVVDPKDVRHDDHSNEMIGFFISKINETYKIFTQVCDDLYEIVNCIAVLGKKHITTKNINQEHIQLKRSTTFGEIDISYEGNITNIEELSRWLTENVNPLVRELTFENGEELTEEGLPFLLLFHKPGDTTSVQRFKTAIERELTGERNRVNFLTADGTLFTHPLMHLGKSVDDLPLICIDSFRHMYLFRKFDNVDMPGKLHRFVSDLHTGILHHNFHNPPPEHVKEQLQEIPKHEDKPVPLKTETPIEVANGVIRETLPNEESIRKLEKETSKSEAETTSAPSKVNPPETIFQKLAPSKHRYSLLRTGDYSGKARDEL